MDSFIIGLWGRILAALRWVSPLELIFVARPHLRTHGWVDVWVLLNICLSAMTMWFASHYAGSGFVNCLMIYAAIRTFEIMAYQAKVVLFDPYRSPRLTSDYAVRSYRRIVLLALHNYLEVAFWFASAYANYRHLFGPYPMRLSTPVGAFYYSMVTMATLGYGEITPQTDTARALVAVHLLVAVFMTLVILARFISYLPVPRSLDDSESIAPPAQQVTAPALGRQREGKAMDGEITDTQREEWSRHYDRIQWSVIAIFTAGVGALTAYSESQPITCGLAPWAQVGGLALVLLGVFYVASFRSFRATQHSAIKNTGLKEFLDDPGGSRGPRQWTVFVLSFAAIGLFLAWRLALRSKQFGIVFVLCLVVLGATLYSCWRLGQPRKAKAKGAGQ